MKKGQREELRSDHLFNIGTIEAMDRTAGQAKLIVQYCITLKNRSLGASHLLVSIVRSNTTKNRRNWQSFFKGAQA